MEDASVRLEQLRASADRYDGFAETAELMGDESGANRFRSLANRRRLQAMELLDDRTPVACGVRSAPVPSR